MRILWASNAPTLPSAFGQQTGLFVSRLKASGHPVCVFALCGCDGAPLNLPDGTLVLPRSARPYGEDVVREHFNLADADVLVSLLDPHALDPEIYGRLPWVAWAPFEGAPVPASTLRSLRAARWVWAPSRFCQAALRKAGVEVAYVPHGVDSRVFKPGDRDASRAALSQVLGQDLTGKFLVAMVAANTSSPSRKGFYEAFAAFTKFSDMRQDAVLYVHAEVSGVFGGEDLREVAVLVGLNPERVVFGPQYSIACGMVAPVYLATVYDAADVFLSASHAEGFGLPIIEAQMTGCPVIAPMNTAQRETCMTGWRAEADPYMPHVGVEWGRPRVSSLVDCLEASYAARSDSSARTLARERALVYDADRVFEEHMLPELRRIEQEIEESRRG